MRFIPVKISQHLPAMAISEMNCVGRCLQSASEQDAACRIDEKIRKLEEQLVKHRETIKKARPGPAQDAAKRRALGVSCQQHARYSRPYQS